MKVILLTCILTVALCQESLRTILHSPKAAMKLYSEFKKSEHLKFDKAEDRLRFQLFRDNAAKVADYNDEVDETATFGINFFSSMTSEEKQLYLGLNLTGHDTNPPDTRLRASPTGPSSVFWTNNNAVTAVKNQGSCGSCWTFGAVGGLETRYFLKAKKLKSFAEQEYLDCAYEHESGKDGCKGGWMDDCYKYSAQNGGRLATTRNYVYTGNDGRCQSRYKKNGMKAYKITGSTKIDASEAANIEALQGGSITVAFEVTDKCQQYRGGILKDTTCTSYANHAVTAVGYASSFILVKNSWGSGWGDKGYIKFARNHHNCRMYEYSSYPMLQYTGGTDTDPADQATDYRADEDDTGPEPCKNEWEDYSCNYYYNAGYCIDYYASVLAHCKLSCKLCEGSNECAPGTIRCPDGVCRHEHMC